MSRRTNAVSRPSLLRLLALISLVPVVLTGCADVGYYSQAIGGHFGILGRTRPIDEMLADPTLPPPVRQRLERVAAIRNFASQSLGLPDNDSYRRYADLERPFAVWNVF